MQLQFWCLAMVCLCLWHWKVSLGWYSVFDTLEYKMRLGYEMRMFGSCVEAGAQFLWLKCWGKKGGRLREGTAERKNTLKDHCNQLIWCATANRHRTSLYKFFWLGMKPQEIGNELEWVVLWCPSALSAWGPCVHSISVQNTSFLPPSWVCARHTPLFM